MTDDELLAERARHLARPLVVEAVDDRRAIVATIGRQQYAFALDGVRRAATLGALTPVPHAPPIVLGLGTLAGNVVAVFDGPYWASGVSRARSERISVLVLGAGTGEPLVLAVDGFEGSIALPAAAPPVPPGAAPWLQFITETGVLVVDVAALVRDPVFSPGRASPAGATQ